MNDWREAFIAMSALFGEPLDAIESAAEIPLAAQLRDEDKTRRALSLSRALGEIAIEIENLEMEISF
jgi:hypothetical protein